MTQQNLDFGTGSPNDGEKLFSAFTKVQENFDDLYGRAIYAEDFGAVGDGVTNDTAAINLMFAQARTLVSTAVHSSGQTVEVHFESGKTYLVNGSINATGIRGYGFTIDGHGALINAKCTGLPVLDMMGSNRFTMRNLNIWGDSTSKPSYGIQFGTTTTASNGSSNIFDNVRVDGYYSTTCMYVFGSETNDYRSLLLHNLDTGANSYCLVLDGRNAYGATSAFITQTCATNTDITFIENLFTNIDMLKASGSALQIAGNTSNLKFINSYIATYDAPAIKTLTSTLLRDLVFDIHCETTGATRMLLVDNTSPSSTVVFDGLVLRDHNPWCSNSLIDASGNTRNIAIVGLDVRIGSPQFTPKIFGNGAGDASKIKAVGRIEWGADSGQTLDLSNGYFDGEIVTRASTPITHTLGTYEIYYDPSTSGDRVKTIKGTTRFYGTPGSASPANYFEITGGTPGNPNILIGSGSDVTPTTVIIGGTGIASGLTLQSTNAAGASDYVRIKVGNNGAVTAGEWDTLGRLTTTIASASVGVTQSPGDNSTKIATTAYADAAAAAIIAAADAMVFKGVIDASANPNYPAADRGHTYRVSVAGKIGGASGASVEAGDIIICLTDGTLAGTQAGVGASWSIVQTNLDGAVIGPASATDGTFARFDGTTGKLLKDGLSSSGLLDLVGSTRGQILYRGASGWAALSPGTAGLPLVSAGAGADPLYSTVALAALSGFGTNVATALGVNVGSAGAFVTFNGALGTPSSGTLSGCTGLPISTGVSGLGAGVATFLATPSSANLSSAVTASAWSTFSSTVTSGTGTLTSASGTVRYFTIGKAVYWEIDITITTNGTGSGTILFTLPTTPKSTTPFIGINKSASQLLVAFPPNAGVNSVQLTKYDSTYPTDGGDGRFLSVGGVYETA